MSLEKDVEQLKQYVYGNDDTADRPYALTISKETYTWLRTDHQTYAYADGRMVLVKIGANVTNAMPEGEYIKIAKIPVDLHAESMAMHPCSGGGFLLIRVKTDGEIDLYRYAGQNDVHGWCRATIPVFIAR